MSLTSLKGVSTLKDATFTRQLAANLVEFFNWGLLDADGFFNVRIPSSGQYGGNKHILRYVNDPNFASGQVWEGFRPNWVWESGLSDNPIRISGIYVNNIFYESATTGTYSHYVDYPRGRIVFNNGISTNSTVKTEYSYKWANFLPAESPEFRQVLERAYRVDSPGFTAVNSGDWYPLSQNRVTFPSVFLEFGSTKFKPWALGGWQTIQQDVLFHVFAENMGDRDKLTDIIAIQNDRSFALFNINTIATDNKYPLNNQGSIVSGAQTYPQFIAATGYFWKKGYMHDTYKQETEQIKPLLYHGLVRMTIDLEPGTI